MLPAYKTIFSEITYTTNRLGRPETKACLAFSLSTGWRRYQGCSAPDLETRWNRWQQQLVLLQIIPRWGRICCCYSL